MICQICGLRPRYRRTRCQRCLRFLERHGVERPADWNTPGAATWPCRDCGLRMVRYGQRCAACEDAQPRHRLGSPTERCAQARRNTAREQPA